MNPQITATQVLDALTELLPLTLDELRGRKRDKLRHIARQLGLTRYSRLRKDELIDAIWGELENARARLEYERNERESAEKALKNARQQNDEYSIPPSEIAEKTYQAIRAAVVRAETLDDLKTAILPIVAKVAATEASSYEFSTVRRRRSEIYKSMEAMAASEGGLMQQDMADAVAFFYSQLLAFQKEASIDFNREYQSRVVASNRAKSIVSAAGIFKRVRATFDRLASGDTDIKWEDLSIAVALSTGRRMVEIHSLGGFKPTSDQYRLHFTGQAKTRDAEGAKDAFEIPTLFPATLTLQAFRILCERGKRIDKAVQQDNPRAVNRRYGKPLSAALAGFASIGYKTLRTIYASACWYRLPDDLKARTEKHSMYSEWLGHTEKPGQPKTTFMSYMQVAVTDLDKCGI